MLFIPLGAALLLAFVQFWLPVLIAIVFYKRLRAINEELKVIQGKVNYIRDHMGDES